MLLRCVSTDVGVCVAVIALRGTAHASTSVDIDLQVRRRDTTV